MPFYKILFLMTATTLSHARPLMIAHAGGGINGHNYSNSLEALEFNYTKGFRHFEMDFSWTADDELICLHDWKKRFKKVFGFKTKQSLTLKSFQQLLDNTKGLHPCTLDTFASWVLSHKDVKIITDVKYNNIKAIKKIIDRYPKLQPQLIIQFYQPEEYPILKHMGFDKFIWILYQYQGSLKSVASHVESMDLLAVSMRASQVKKRPMQNMQKKGVNLFVYTINKENNVKKLVNKYFVSGIYTDFLSPN
jgi:glycerophosphoryl diester phosphodiesterase